MKEQEDISIVKDIREKLLEYVLKGIPEKDSYYVSTKSFVDTRVEDTFTRIGGYWEALLNNYKNAESRGIIPANAK